VNVLIAIYSPFTMWTIPPTHVERLRQTFPAHTFLHAHSPEETLALIADADAAFSAQIMPPQLAAARRLRWIHSPAAGVGGMLYREMVESPIVVTNARGLSADTIAEHVLAVTLAFFRRLPHAWRSQAAHEWAQEAISKAGNRQIAGSRVLVIGLGAIGVAVARRMTLLGAHVTGLRRSAAHSVGDVAEVASIDRRHEFLPTADVVVVAAPHTPETRQLIGAPELRLMSRDAILINVSRGPLIDEAALIAALQQQSIGGAALDVFVDEPLKPDSPFWALPNVLITPHTSGSRMDYWNAAISLFGDNLRRFERGAPLVNIVDKVAGY
jgi:phosphoglycerate dehydrogenase-like enzyme